MKNDLRGQRFGRLTALEPTDRRSRGCLVWRCRCDCGAEVEVESRRLKPGAMLSCGCKEKPPSDLMGCRFGKLVVLEKTEKRAANRAVIWRCRCDCGAETEVPRDKLLSGQKTSCGCGRTPLQKDWVGRRFGHLTVTAYAGKENGSHLWRCRCDCGGETVVRQSNLQSGQTVSCGCEQKARKGLHFVDGTLLERLTPGRLSRANTSGVRGVYFNRRRNKWVAQIMFRGKDYYLGGYPTLEEAARARRDGEAMFQAFLEEHSGTLDTTPAGAPEHRLTCE